MYMVDYLKSSQFDVYLTHLHYDHTWGLVDIEFILLKKLTRDAIAENQKPSLDPIFKSLKEFPPRVRVHLASEHLESVQNQVQGSRNFKYMEFASLRGTEELSDGVTITPFSVDPRVNELCFDFRLGRPGGSLAYVTDTYGEPGVRYLESIRGVDVLLHDCYMPDHDPEVARAIGHSHITPVLN